MTFWEERDLPVLEYLFQNRPARENWFSPQSLVAQGTAPAGVSRGQMNEAMALLQRDDLLTCDGCEPDNEGGWSYWGIIITGDGMRALRQWPPFDALQSGERLSEVFDLLAGKAEGEAAEGLRGASERTRSGLVEGVRTILVAGVNAWIRARTGG